MIRDLKSILLLQAFSVVIAYIFGVRHLDEIHSNQRKNIERVILVVLGAMTIWAYLSAMFTDPGRPPKDYVS